MADGGVFNIGSQHANGNIYNIAGDMTINESSPAEDVLKIVQAIQGKVGELEAKDSVKEQAATHLQNAANELQAEEPNKKTVAESLKSTVEVLKEGKAVGDAIKDVAGYITKIAVWFGITTSGLGLPF